MAFAEIPPDRCCNAPFLHFPFCVLECRLVLLFFPTKSKDLFSRRNAKIYIGVSWLLPCFFVWPSLAGVYGRNALECVSRSCTIIDDHNGHSIKKFLMVLGVALPLIVLTVTNVSIFVKVKVSVEISTNLMP